VSPNVLSLLPSAAYPLAGASPHPELASTYYSTRQQRATVALCTADSLASLQLALYACTAVAVDLWALLWLARAVSRLYIALKARVSHTHAWNRAPCCHTPVLTLPILYCSFHKDFDAAVALLAPNQRRLLNLPEPRSFAGRPPVSLKPAAASTPNAASDPRRRQVRVLAHLRG